MEISIKLNEENSKRLLALKEMGILSLDIDCICNDAIKKQLDICADIYSEWVEDFEGGSFRP